LTPRDGFIILRLSGNSPASLCQCNRPLRSRQLAPHHGVQVQTTSLYRVSEDSVHNTATLRLNWSLVGTYTTALPADHHVPWGEFRTTFHAHHLSAGLLRSKLKKFLDLEQGNHSVFNYTRQCNTLAQYDSYHVDTDEKKANLYREGLTIQPQGHLVQSPNLSYNELASAAIAQQRTMKAILRSRRKREKG
jgi:hypothetical protein